MIARPGQNQKPADVTQAARVFADADRAQPAANSIFFWDQLEQHGETVALVDGAGQELTYAQLAAMADLFAAQLPSGRQLVALEALNEPEAVGAYLACLRHGHAVILLNSGALKDGRIAATFKPNVVYARAGGAWKLDHASAEPVALTPDLAVLLSTSGTTGSPKLVKLSREAIDANARSIGEYLGLSGQERAITTLNFFYSYGMAVLNSHLATGARLILTDESFVAPKFWDAFRAHGATSLALVPYHFELLDQIGFADMDLPSLKYVTQAGGRLADEKIKAYAELGAAKGWRLFVMYGQTEAGPRISYVPPEDLLDNLDTIGRAVPGGEIVLIDEDGAEITRPGRTGELVYKGPNVMLGYAETAEDLATPRDTVALRTGDMAQLNANGYFRIVGRLKRFIKLYGLRINLDDVESFLDSRGVHAYCTGTDQTLAVFTADATDGAAIARQLNERYSLNANDITVVKISEPPMLASGKVDYATLTQMIPAKVARAPAEAAQISVRDAFTENLGVETVADDDTFAKLGGDSLAYLNISISIEGKLGFLPKRWEQMTVREIEALKPAKTSVSTLPIDNLIRVVSMLSVVTLHVTDLPLRGGVMALLMLAGLSFARVQRERLGAGEFFSVLAATLGRVLIVYYSVMLAYIGVQTLRGEGSIAEFAPWLLLYENLAPVESPLYAYWFICAFAQIVLFVALLWRAPPLRRFFAAQPLRFGYILTALGFVLAVVSKQITPSYAHFSFSSLSLLHLFALGWVVLFSQTTREKLIASAIAIAATLTFWSGSDAGFEQPFYISAAALLAIWLDRVPMPRPIASTINWLASYSFMIYVAHVIPAWYFLNNDPFPVSGVAATLLEWTTTVVVAIGVGAVLSFLLNQGARQLRKMRRGAGSVETNEGAVA